MLSACCAWQAASSQQAAPFPHLSFPQQQTELKHDYEVLQTEANDEPP